ncbi:MAG: methionyl-tRNA synthetase [Chthoniobacter sp.]|jgi:methionyl-tRNA synthetase|nr:methionyl-tRNA synthetase [Chthoniobacter sp.]
MSTFFLTTAIDYTNGAPHIGHAYEKVLADVLARYHRLKGDEVFFLTGVDQHGQKVQQSAEKQGVPPQQFVDNITAKFVALWDKLDVQYSKPGGWAATTDAIHKECVRANLQMLWDEKVPGTDRSRWIYQKTQRGFYSVRQEQFLTDKERGPDGEFGPEWQPVEEREEENFYFRLTAHPDLGFDPKQWLLDLIDQRSRDGKPFVVPDFRVAELRNAVEKLDGDLCISRPASRLKWGIPFPESFGAGYVTYVWFDALVNYITYVPGHDPNYRERAAGGKAPGVLSFQDWWPPLHVIGKDILIPAHGIYWPIMLKALGFTDDEMPTLLVHGWWNIAGAKMSKSLGNIVDPDALADKYGAEAVRYYLMSDIATGWDADFSEDRFIQRYNTVLANNLGNLLNRTLNMAQRYRSGLVRFTSRPPMGSSEELVSSYQAEMDTTVSHSKPANVSTALAVVSVLMDRCNGTVDSKAPWKLAKDPAQAEELDVVLYSLAESLRIIAILISPILPKAAHGIFDQLNWKMDEQRQETRFRLAEATWGGLPDGHVLGKPTPLFPRIEAPVEPTK